ncbi:hypothetical protein K8F61_17190 [Microbacterium resistens]|uniref:Uncharacterized protein n=1 Tax=Microbacterium resistens TaxID=156977 RepID=A0ABY3RQV4_9MICO|nr:hypothetical protein [Microbacterium resistens]UGS26339.1 hypothetical protein K8F61_17190 [Microbacterium resistens]
MGRTTKFPAADQNVGQSYGACNAGPVTWNTVRFSDPEEIWFRPMNIEFGETWDTAKFSIWICRPNGTPVLSGVATKAWGIAPAWTNLGRWPGGGFVLRTAVTAYSNSKGSLNCRFGSWQGELSYVPTPGTTG